MQAKIQKWGNSLGLRIPKAFALEADVGEGSTVDLSVENGNILVRPQEGRKYVLSQLLREVNRSNIHAEVETGASVGREIW